MAARIGKYTLMALSSFRALQNFPGKAPVPGEFLENAEIGRNP
jgi:hypothetical protein